MKYKISGPIYLVFVIISSCSPFKSSTFGYKKTEAKDTITTLQQRASSKLVVLKAGNGKLYYAKNVIDSALDRLVIMSDPVSVSSSASLTEIFKNGLGGGVREEAKTTFAAGPFKKITVKKLVTSFASPGDMDQFNLGNNSPRVVLEKKNVWIKRAYLYIVKHEDDNDYHFIFGDKPNYIEASYIMNGEISALPVNFRKDANQLRAVRKKAIDFFKSIQQCGTSSYILSIPFEIKGSLFYDFFHRNNTARCLEVKSKTPWEIHPVYDIKFN